MGEAGICAGGRNEVSAVSSMSHNKIPVRSCTAVSSAEIQFQTRGCKAGINSLR